jgi:hypothetical protein
MLSPHLERIKKLLSLAESANEHEAALAAARAQELLDLHKLSLSEVDAELFEADNPVGEDLLSDDADVGRYKMTWVGWKCSLLSMVARMNGCTVIRTRAFRVRTKGDRFFLLPKPGWASRLADKREEWKEMIVIVGRESDRQITEYLGTYLMREIERLAKVDYEAAHGTTDYRGLQRWTTSFAHPEMKAVVRRDSDAVREYLEKAFGGPLGHGGAQSHASISMDAVRRGERAGEQIQWHSAVRPAKASRQIE